MVLQAMVSSAHELAEAIEVHLEVALEQQQQLAEVLGLARTVRVVTLEVAVAPACVPLPASIASRQTVRHGACVILVAGVQVRRSGEGVMQEVEVRGRRIQAAPPSA